MTQVNKLKRIVIASVLKPVDEIRMYGKFGTSLAALDEFEIHIIGFPIQRKADTAKNIYLHPISKNSFSRISLNRMYAPFNVARMILSIRPHILIVATHELLIPAVIIRIITGCKLIYDVQENYYRNINYGNAFPPFICSMVAGWVRLKEKLCSLWIELFILAEKAYSNELKFATPFLVIQNKLPGKIVNQYRRKGQRGYHQLLFSGTLAESNGVYDAIRIVTGLHSLDPDVRLTIIGYAPLNSDFDRIKKLTSGKSFINLITQSTPVPHYKILDEIQRADFGLICYPRNPSTRSSIPTKFYEYMSLGLPFLISHSDETHQLTISTKSGIVLKEPVDYKGLIHQMRHFQPGHSQIDLLFDSEFNQLIPFLKK